MRNGFLIGFALSIVQVASFAGDAAKKAPASPKITAKPDQLVIADHEGVIDFKVLELQGLNGGTFKVMAANSEHQLINVNGPVGLEIRKSGFLVYLASTLKPGSYRDTIVFRYTSSSREGELKVPVNITVSPAGERVSVLIGNAATEQAVSAAR